MRDFSAIFEKMNYEDACRLNRAAPSLLIALENAAETISLTSDFAERDRNLGLAKTLANKAADARAAIARALGETP